MPPVRSAPSPSSSRLSGDFVNVPLNDHNNDVEAEAQNSAPRPSSRPLSTAWSARSSSPGPTSYIPLSSFKTLQSSSSTMALAPDLEANDDPNHQRGVPPRPPRTPLEKVLHALDQSKPTKKQMMQIGANLAGVAVGSGAMTGGFSYMHANQAKHLIKQDFSPGAGGVWVDVPQAETKQLIWGKNKFPLIGAGVGLAGSLAASALMAKMTGDAPSQKGHRIGQVAIGVAVSTLFTGSFEGHNAVYQQYQETDGTIAARPYDPYVDINKIFPPLNKDDFKEATVYRLVRTREAGTSTAEQGVGPFDTSRFEEGGWTSVKGKSTTKADGATLPIYRTVDTWDATTNTITTTTATGEKENSSIMQRQKNTLFEQFTPISTFTLEPSEVSDLSSQSRFHGSYTPTFTPTPTTMPVSVTTSHTAGTMGGCKREYLDSMAAQITPPPSLNDLD